MSTPRIISWTGSYINTLGRALLIQYTIDSLQAQAITEIQISMFIKPELQEFLAPWLTKIKSNERIKLHLQTKKFSQFDHLAYLCERHNGADEDMILFMDDDDLLLELPEWNSYDVLQGMQYIPIQTSDLDGTSFMNHEQVLEIKPEWSSRWDVMEDFSGYQARFRIVKQYFELCIAKEVVKRNRIADCPKLAVLENFRSGLEDCDFMKYLDEQSKRNTPKAFIFHRLWEDATEPTQTRAWLNVF